MFLPVKNYFMGTVGDDENEVVAPQNFVASARHLATLFARGGITI
jgi:hypothetical protein